MQPIPAVGFPDLFQAEFPRFLFSPAQHGSLHIEEERSQNDLKDRPSSPFLCCGRAESRKNVLGSTICRDVLDHLIAVVTRIWRLDSWLWQSAFDRAPSSAFRAPTRVLTRAGTRASRIAAMATAAFDQSIHSSPADHRCAKKNFRETPCDDPRAPLSARDGARPASRSRSR